jgi:hypothetical protein
MDGIAFYITMNKSNKTNTKETTKNSTRKSRNDETFRAELSQVDAINDLQASGTDIGSIIEVLDQGSPTRLERRLLSNALRTIKEAVDNIAATVRNSAKTTTHHGYSYIETVAKRMKKTKVNGKW